MAFGVMGVIGIGWFNTILYFAARSTETHNLSLVISTAPIWTFILACLLRQESFNVAKLLGALLAAGGAILVISRGSIDVLQALHFSEGDLLGLISAWIWAIYCVLLKYKPKEMAAEAFIFFLVVIGVITLTPFFIWDVFRNGWVAWTLKQ